MRFRLDKTSKSLGLVFAILALGACSGTEIRRCPDENEALLSDGTIKLQQFQAVRDPTAGGRLKGPPPEGTDRPVKTILLLDYSGSMFPGYGRAAIPGCHSCSAGLDKAGKSTRGQQPFYFDQPAFLSLLGRWLDAATPRDIGQGLEIVLFNAQLWRLGQSGVEPFRGGEQLTFERPLGTARSDQIIAWLGEIPGSPYEVNPAAANSTESEGALLSMLEAIPDEAVIWMVTDNIVDRGNAGTSTEDARRNLAFYNLILRDPRIQMVAAYPLHEAEACSWMCGTSLFVYGFHVSRFERPGSAETHRLAGTTPAGGPTAEGLLWNTALKTIAAESSGRAANAQMDLGGVPLRLKPVDAEVLSFEFKLHAGKQAFVCNKRTEIGEILRCGIEATISNTLRHQKVDSAKLTFRNQTLLPRKPNQQERLPWASAVCAGEMQSVGWKVNGQLVAQDGKNQIEIGPMAPLEKKVVQAVFDIPAVAVDTTQWSHVFDIALTEEILLDGRVVAELRGIRTSLAVDTQGLEQVYGAPELPRIFHGQEQSYIEAVYPAGAVVANNGQILGLLVLLGGGGLMLLLALVLMRFQRIHLLVLLDGMEHSKVSLPRLSYQWVSLSGAARIMVIRGWGREIRLRAGAGYRVRKDGSTWLLVDPGGGPDLRVELRRGWGGAGRRTRPGGSANDRW